MGLHLWCTVRGALAWDTGISAMHEEEVPWSVLKDEGGKFFMSGDYNAADSSYMRAIHCFGVRDAVVILCNRAAAMLAHHQASTAHLLQQAACDASVAAILDPCFAKAWVRRAQALEKLGCGTQLEMLSGVQLPEVQKKVAQFAKEKKQQTDKADPSAFQLTNQAVGPNLAIAFQLTERYLKADACEQAKAMDRYGALFLQEMSWSRPEELAEIRGSWPDGLSPQTCSKLAHHVFQRGRVSPWLQEHAVKNGTLTFTGEEITNLRFCGDCRQAVCGSIIQACMRSGQP
eukprot:1839682-Prymnesium_polylepis.1